MGPASDSLVITLDNETMGDDFSTIATSVTFGGSPLVLPEGQIIEEKVLTPVFTSATTTTPGTESVKNRVSGRVVGDSRVAMTASAGVSRLEEFFGGCAVRR